MTLANGAVRQPRRGDPVFFRGPERFTTRVLKSRPIAKRVRPSTRLNESLATPVVIVAAEATDIPLVGRLARDIWHRHYPGIISREQIDYMLASGYSHEALLRYLTEPGAGLALARRGAPAVGFIGWYRLDADTMKLDKLYVLPEHHGEGIGRALIEHVVARARDAGCPMVKLNVNRRNTPAIEAYERCGFAIRERGDFPIGDGFVMEDFVMVRSVQRTA
jgi:GNAT superfamily N-acetyltransferase